MEASKALAAFPGYSSKTFTFKTTSDGELKVDVLAPDARTEGPATVLVHYHGGFLIVGDRYAFLPYWLVNACVSRGWIFVTPDYRLLPEMTAHSSVEDAMDAYQWVLTSLPQAMGGEVGSVILAGSSAGAYLVLASATRLLKQPSALVLIYGMLDATQQRYISPGTNISGRSVTDTGSVLTKFPMATQGPRRPAISTYPLAADLSADIRFGLVAALHIEALFPDYMTGVAGLSRSIARDGIEVIPETHRILFPLTFPSLVGLPRTFILHGKNDSAVPTTQSRTASEKLRAAGVEVYTEFPVDAEHGFDARLGNINIEGEGEQTIPAFRSLQEAIKFLDTTVRGK